MSESHDIVAAIDTAIGCQRCGGTLATSPSDDFCTDECQTAWHAELLRPLPVAVLLLAALWWGLSAWNEHETRRVEEKSRARDAFIEELNRREALQEQIDWEVRQHQLDPSYPYPEQVPVCPPWQEPWVLSVSIGGAVEARCQ